MSVVRPLAAGRAGKEDFEVPNLAVILEQSVACLADSLGDGVAIVGDSRQPDGLVDIVALRADDELEVAWHTR